MPGILKINYEEHSRRLNHVKKEQWRQSKLYKKEQLGISSQDCSKMFRIQFSHWLKLIHKLKSRSSIFRKPKTGPVSW